MRIVVLAGGLSPERDVSLCSGSLIANALMGNGHEVALVDLFFGPPAGELDAAFSKPGRKTFSHPVPKAEPDLAALVAARGSGPRPVGPRILELCARADVSFVALHGGIGENGQLQAMLEIDGIKFTGTGSLGCALAMDKDISKRLMLRAGVDTAEWILVDLRSGALPDMGTVGYPCVVKPLSCGSSVGVSMVDHEDELRGAIAAARAWEEAVLIERKVEGREFSCGVLGGRALPVIEIRPRRGFYDYANKYQAGAAEEICPAELPPADATRIQEAALKTHAALRLGFYSRTDFILGANGELCCLESNTLPGMTPTSLLPQEAAVAGIPYPQLCEMIARAALGD